MIVRDSVAEEGEGGGDGTARGRSILSRDDSRRTVMLEIRRDDAHRPALLCLWNKQNGIVGLRDRPRHLMPMAR